MNEKLREHIEELFKNAPQTRQAVEIKEEILQNTIDRYNDLKAEGKSDEAAYNIAIAGIGDVDHLIDSIIAPVASSGYSREEIRKNQNKRTLLLAVAVALYILCVVPVIICDEIGVNEVFGIVSMFVIAAVATALIIYRSGMRLEYMPTDDTVVEDFKKWNHEKKRGPLAYGGCKRRCLGAYLNGVFCYKLFNRGLVYKLAYFHNRRRGLQYSKSGFRFKEMRCA